MIRIDRYCGSVVLQGLVLALASSFSFSWAPGSGAADGMSVNASASGSTGAPGARAVSIVSCSGKSCSVTLGGHGSTAQVFATAIFLEEIRGGRATLRVADRLISCAAGQRVAVGPLLLRCTTVTADTVTFTGSLS
jgi:hypothetical protein